MDNNDLLNFVNYPSNYLPSYIVYKISQEYNTCSTTSTPQVASFYDKFIKIQNLLPYGRSYGDSVLSKGDDESTRVYLNNGALIFVYDQAYNYVYIGINGYLSFRYTPRQIFLNS